MTDTTEPNYKDFTYIPSNNILNEFEIIGNDNPLFEISMVELMNNTVKPGNFNTKMRQHSTDEIIVNEMKITSYVGMKTLLVRAVVHSGLSGKEYDCQLLFKKVQFIDEPDDVEDISDDEIVEFVGSDGETYYIKRIDMGKSDVSVRCNCLDMRFSHSTRLSKVKALYGKPFPKYNPKTDRLGHNLKNVPALCKHLIKVGNVIAQSNLTTEFDIP